MTTKRVLVVVALAGLTLASTALASGVHAAELATVDHSGSWTVGTLAFGGAVPMHPPAGPVSNGVTPYATVDIPDRVSDLHDKVRIGGTVVPGLDGSATVRPWVSVEPAADGRLHGMSGVLVDVPVGSFVFTPSVGAGYINHSALDAAPTVQFRSQIELGYEFENKARFALGYSRITSDDSDGRDPNNVFGLYYRLPFGGGGQ